MLLKYSQLQKRNKVVGSGKPQRTTGKVKIAGKGKGHRKGFRGLANKRIKTVARKDEVYSHPVDPCDNSNDSGLGFDHHLEFQLPRTAQTTFIEQECIWPNGEAKRQKFDVKLESDNANDNFTFPHAPKVVLPSPVPTTYSRVQTSTSGKCLKRGSQVHQAQNIGLTKDGKVQLVILSQPEMQHRARYQTEGSRGAVKDRTGNGFPVVKLIGYDKPAILEVYIGTDQGRETPHMFYQACRVAGKNSTPCVEKNVDGTVLIEIEFDPSKDMTVTCDCVGILKERNVDVEHRFPDESSARSKKKSTRCRMVFRTVITNSDHTHETLQVTSQPIICTQPPGVPEICKKSLVSCQATGGLELFILGKNFLKDTRVIFSEGDINDDNYWEDIVQPDKEFLQQSHLVCTIPPYKIEDIKESVIVKLSIVSSGRSSEAHTFIYTPIGTPPLQALPREPIVAARAALTHCINPPPVSYTSRNLLLGIPLIQLGTPSLPASTFMPSDSCKRVEESGAHSTILMPPPISTALPPTRRPSQSMSSVMEDCNELKREAESPTTQSVNPDLLSSQTPSMATIRQFVSNTPLPSLSVENYLSKIESNPPLPPTQVPFNQPKGFNETSNISSRDEIVARLEEQIGVSISNDVQDVTNMGAFVKSSVESQLSPGHEVQTNLQTSSGEELLNSIGLTQQSSPLNLNTHENIASAISPRPMMSLEPKPMSPVQTELCNLLANSTQSSSIPISSQMLDSNLVAEQPSILLNPTFSPGKNIVVSTSNDLNIGQLPGASDFSKIPITSTSDSNNLLMKVVDSLNQSQFNSHATLQNSAQVNSLQTNLMVSTSFVPHEQVEEPMRISSADYITTESLVNNKDLIKTEGSNQSHFSSSIMPITFTKHSSHMMSSECAQNMTSSNSGNAGIIVNGNCDMSSNSGIVISNHFSPAVINTSPIPLSGSVDNVKTLSPEMNSTFSDSMIYSAAQKVPIVTSEPTDLERNAINDVQRISMDGKNDQFIPTSFPSQQMNDSTSSPPTSLVVDANIMTSSSVNLSQKVDGNLSLVEGSNEGYHQGIPIANDFPSPQTSQVPTVFIGVSTATCAVTNLSSSSAASVSSSTSAPENTGVPQNKSVPLTSDVPASIKKCEEGMPFTHELTQMSDHDLLSYINPSCFDTV